VAYNLADLFEHTVDLVADREVLVVGDERRTYGQLEQRGNRLAHHLIAAGIQPGDHLGIYGANSAEWIEGALAAYKVRAVPVNVNYRYVEEELRYLFDNADLKALIYDLELAPRIESVRGSLPLLEHLIHIDDGSGAAPVAGSIAFEDAVAAGGPERDFGPRSDDDHYIIYTGGTTGMPKGVVWRHEDVFFALGGGIDAYTNERVGDEWTLAKKAAEAVVVEGQTSGLTSLNLPPLMHGAAQWGFWRFAFEGNRVVFLGRRFDPAEVWRTIEREKVNTVSITGDAMARPMIEALDELGGPSALDLSSMLVLASTAAIFSPTVKDRFLEAFPNLILIDAIGSSETGSNGMRMVTGAAGIDDHAGTQNKGGGPTVQAARDAVVLDADFNELPAGSGLQGRLARRGNVPLAYHKDPDKSAATFVTGPTGLRYALAGDEAVLEADGTITLLGRGSQCINSGGEKIFPEEVEAALKAHPEVFDAIVVGVPDDRWGQRVAAVVQPRPGCAPSLDALDAHCRGYVAGYKVPKEVHLVPEVVRSPSGKPDYPWAGKVARGEIRP
jgi:acyl-CoA synthetase (AMP-forming)/AMP-acid ligase II